ncbi:hypothetical protein [Alkalihalobacillus trypoxylicola]|uniref:Uncharacterized protein n=2 Tax=Alkalihalobacillus trypoxylicola TaxID=519424 RepID=A0A162DGB2_9BACI|nr:hypothetical protein [Alkalihalobacillus trypoxylicola]KYG29535.1 hypothetical protein AZF04_08420 [Alkalihalobacillus trypoxylicola]
MESLFALKKTWEDERFFEANFNIVGQNSSIIMDSYLDESEISKLIDGVKDFIESFGKEEFIWRLEFTEDTPLLSLRFFLQNKVGVIGIEVSADNKLEVPEKLQANFYLTTEFDRLDVFVSKLASFQKGSVLELKVAL